MSVVEVLAQLVGRATRPALLCHVSERDLRRAVAAGDVLRSGRGRYRLPALDAGVAAAHGIRGALVLRSAALWHG